MHISSTSRLLARLHPPIRVEAFLVRLLLMVIVAIVMVKSYAWVLEIRYPGWWQQASVERLVNGTADRPFVYRQLVPQMVRFVDSLVSEEILQSVSKPAFKLYLDTTKRMKRLTERKKRSLENIKDKHVKYWFIASCITLLFLCGYGMCTFLLARHFYEQPIAPYVAIIIAYSIIPIGLFRAAHPYDMSVLFFIAACFYAIIKHELFWLIALFLLASINKETSVYVILLYALLAKKDTNYIKIIIALFAIWAAVTLWTHVIYADNRGVAITMHWFKVDYIQRLGVSLSFNKMATLFATFFIIMYKWDEKPLLVRRSMWVVAVSIIAWILFGIISEMRAMYEAYPFLVLMLTHSILSATQIHKARLFRHV